MMVKRVRPLCHSLACKVACYGYGSCPDEEERETLKRRPEAQVEEREKALEECAVIADRYAEDAKGVYNPGIHFKQFKGAKMALRDGARAIAKTIRSLNTIDSEEIRCCPFCGGASLRVASILGSWHVICLDCHARGPDCEDKEEAIEAWNDR